jgi:hypothetical protein
MSTSKTVKNITKCKQEHVCEPTVNITKYKQEQNCKPNVNIAKCKQEQDCKPNVYILFTIVLLFTFSYVYSWSTFSYVCC